MRYYIIAGERSGDLHGGNLVKAIRKHDPHAVFRGLGGDYLREAGVELFLHYREFAIMGFAEVLLNLVRISRYLRRCREDIAGFRPDVLILIDYPGFNQQMARFARKNNLKVFYYISPKVWAWYQSRAYQLKAKVDRMFVILPFEKDFYRKFAWEVDYVGNPVLDAVKAHVPSPDFQAKANLDRSAPVVALLPGSRKQELQSVVPLMKDVVSRFPHVQFAVATVNNLEKDLYGPLEGSDNVRFIHEDTYNLLQHADAAIVTSGTATLETALFRVPQVVVYRTSRISYWLAKRLIRVPYISLVNLIAGKEVVKELIQDQANAGSVSAELEALLNDAAYRDRMLSDYEVIIRILDTGSASENAGKLMVDYLR